MDPFLRVLMGGVAAFGVWRLVSAIRSGVITSEDSEYDIDERPVAFALAALVNTLMIGFSAWLAAGYDTASFLRAIGLRWPSFGGG